jgi:sulfate transport system ATP-binding protein
VIFDGENLTTLSAKDRGVGFVFQHYALFRHMSVFENIAFGLRVRPKATRPSDQVIKTKVMELLRLIQLDNLAERFPSQLSGGQRQRVALARALAIEPRILLLDEPFGALDAKVRQGLRRWLRRLHSEITVTTVLVTHDQDEALEVSDRIVVMNHGKIEQVGTPEEVFHQPANEFVMDFLGQVNLFHARVEGQSRKLMVRPFDLDIVTTKSNDSAVSAKITRINAAGSAVKVELTSEAGDAILVEIPHDKHRGLNLKVGDAVFVSPRESKVFFEDYAI